MCKYIYIAMHAIVHILCNSCNTDMSALPDLHTMLKGAQGPRVSVDTTDNAQVPLHVLQPICYTSGTLKKLSNLTINCSACLYI